MELATAETLLPYQLNEVDGRNLKEDVLEVQAHCVEHCRGYLVVLHHQAHREGQNALEEGVVLEVNIVDAHKSDVHEAQNHEKNRRTP